MAINQTTETSSLLVGLLVACGVKLITVDYEAGQATGMRFELEPDQEPEKAA